MFHSGRREIHLCHAGIVDSVVSGKSSTFVIVSPEWANTTVQAIASRVYNVNSGGSENYEVKVKKVADNSVVTLGAISYTATTNLSTFYQKRTTGLSTYVLKEGDIIYSEVLTTYSQPQGLSFYIIVG